jgi:hypothetical protein
LVAKLTAFGATDAALPALGAPAAARARKLAIGKASATTAKPTTSNITALFMFIFYPYSKGFWELKILIVPSFANRK